MNHYVRKWGNSAAVRIPLPALAAAGLKPDDPVDIREEGGRIVIERAQRHSLDLNALIDGISEDNLHGEADFGEPMGREAW